MNKLERLEKGTPEFQQLTPQQQNQRRKLLSIVLGSVIDQHSSLGLTRKQTVLFAQDLLEFYLTGEIERNLKEPRNPKKNRIK